MLTIIALPNIGDIFASTTPYATGMFTEFTGLVFGVMGISIGALILAFIAKKVYSGIKRLFSGSKKKGRGRRY